MATGHEKWRFKTGYRILSSPAVVEGTIYIAAWMAFSMRSMRYRDMNDWRFKTNERIRSSPAIENHTVYFGGDDGQFYGAGTLRLDKRNGELRQVADHLIGVDR